MKFKKVEVSGFRIYDDPKDATFDFTNENGDIANFISLYAPNGYGKTSFYDAVEWGMTKSFARLLLKEKENEKLVSSQQNQNKLHIIRNFNTTKDTYVKITDQKNESTKQSLPINNRKRSDLNLKADLSNPFHEVILSQEWISAFLKENDAEFRYRKFVEKPELKELDQYYKNIQGLISENDQKINNINENLANLNDKISAVDEDNILEQINKSIKGLLLYDIILPEIQPTASKEDIKLFRDEITQYIVQNEQAEKSNKSYSLQLNDLINGNNEILGYELYAQKCKQLDMLITELKEIDSTLVNFEELKKLVNLNDNLKFDKNKKVEKLNKLKIIHSKFTEFEQINSAIENNRLEIERKTDDKNINNKKLLECSNREIEYIIKLDELIATISILNSSIEKIPDTKASYFSVVKTAYDLTEKQKGLESKRNKISLNSMDIKKQIIDLENIIKELKLNVYNLYKMKEFCNPEEINILKEKIDDYGLLIKSLSELEKDEELIVDRISNQKKLNDDISSFIEKGLELVNKTHDKNCPLCSQDYDSYDVLVSSIVGNNELDKNLQSLLKEHLKIIENKKNNGQQIEELNDSIKHIFHTKKAKLSETTKEYNNLKVSMDDDFDKLEEKVRANAVIFAEIRQILDEYQVPCEGHIYDIEKLADILQKEFSDTNIIKDGLLDQINTNSTQIKSIKTELNILEKQIGTFSDEITKLKLNKEYIEVCKWFQDNFPEIDIGKTILDSEVVEYKQFVSDHTEKISTNTTKIEEISQELAFYKDGELLQKKNLLLSVQEQLLKDTTQYSSAIQTILKSSNLEMDTNQLIITLKNKISIKDKEIAKIQNLAIEFLKIEKYSENIEVFLLSDRAKLEKNDLENKKENWRNIIAPLLEQEREKTLRHLDDKVKNFFYEDLINEIYKKIDPYPDFNNVEFKADFDSDKPRLDVFVRNAESEKIMIPNLYFSTAQLNILSFSIFLASALNSKEYDCIFMDDPIQSMDSINILSIIDLLRSITVNLDKQIILSTHDENFHNLLKKKIPKDMFKSKFLKLETFGKVVEDL